MSDTRPAVIVHAVTFPRLALSILVLSLLLLTGCQTGYWERLNGPYRPYYRVRVMNPRGEFIADYIAEGYVTRTERGYSFQAVERTSKMPDSQTIRYPHGRYIDAAGPNIVVTRSGKPEWLYRMEGY